MTAGRARKRTLLPAAMALLAAGAAAQSAQPEVAKIVASDGAALDSFGEALATDGVYLAVGAPFAAGTRGAVYVYELVAGTWLQSAKLVASDGVLGDLFGHAVAIQGERLVVGARWASPTGLFSAGKVYVYELSAGVWQEQAVLAASDAADYTFFGWSVALDGDLLAAGSPSRDGGKGGGYVFRRLGPTWIEERVLVAPDAAFGDQLGTSVAVSGERVAVGAPYDDDVETSAGAVYVFQRGTGLWPLEQKLTSTQPTPYAQLGGRVDIDGERLVAGATERAQSAPPMTGSVHVFDRIGAAWASTAVLRPADGSDEDAFGSAVALEGDRIAVGADHAEEGGSDSGTVYVFELEFGSWRQVVELASSDLAPVDRLGSAVALDGTRVVAGAPEDDDAGSFAGSAYVFFGDEPGGALCFGDGSGAPCPCGNAGGPGEGCAHRGGRGMSIHGYGSPSAAKDDLMLVVTGCPPGNAGLFYVGTHSPVPASPVLDGLQCVTGVQHLYPGIEQQDGLVVGSAFLAQSGALLLPGSSYYFQYWTRDARGGGSPCGTRANFSPAYRIDLVP